MEDVARELESLLDLSVRLREIDEGTAAYKQTSTSWSPKEILGHLVDSAANNHQRFVRLQLQDHLELPGYEQDGWVRVQAYQDQAWGDLIELWRIYNRHLASLIRNVKSDALRHTWQAPDATIVDLEFIMRDYVGHMKHHLDQVLSKTTDA